MILYHDSNHSLNPNYLNNFHIKNCLFTLYGYLLKFIIYLQILIPVKYLFELTNFLKSLKLVR